EARLGHVVVRRDGQCFALFIPRRLVVAAVEAELRAQMRVPRKVYPERPLVAGFVLGTVREVAREIVVTALEGQARQPRIHRRGTRKPRGEPAECVARGAVVAELERRVSEDRARGNVRRVGGEDRFCDARGRGEIMSRVSQSRQGGKGIGIARVEGERSFEGGPGLRVRAEVAGRTGALQIELSKEEVIE